MTPYEEALLKIIVTCRAIRTTGAVEVLSASTTLSNICAILDNAVTDQLISDVKNQKGTALDVLYHDMVKSRDLGKSQYEKLIKEYSLYRAAYPETDVPSITGTARDEHFTADQIREMMQQVSEHSSPGKTELEKIAEPICEISVVLKDNLSLHVKGSQAFTEAQVKFLIEQINYFCKEGRR